ERENGGLANVPGGRKIRFPHAQGNDIVTPLHQFKKIANPGSRDILYLVRNAILQWLHEILRGGRERNSAADGQPPEGPLVGVRGSNCSSRALHVLGSHGEAFVLVGFPGEETALFVDLELEVRRGGKHPVEGAELFADKTSHFAEVAALDDHDEIVPPTHEKAASDLIEAGDALCQ